MKILVLNAGSSSQKSCLYELNDVLPDRPLQPLWSAQIDWTHQQGIAELKVKTAKGVQVEEEIASNSRQAAIYRMLETLWWRGKTQTINNLTEIDIVGHRVVHGGQDYQQSTLISPDVKKAIARLSVFAPVHNPVNLECI